MIKHLVNPSSFRRNASGVTNTSAKEIANSQKLVEKRIARAVDSLRSLQDESGRILGNDPKSVAFAMNQLNALAKLTYAVTRLTDQGSFAKAFACDIAGWMEAGIDTIPDFTRTRDGYCPGENGNPNFFIGPVACPNGPFPGTRLECFLILPDRPRDCESLLGQLPAGVARSDYVHLLAGSEGYVRGNCIVFFPELVSSLIPMNKQRYGVLLMGKYRHIFLTQTIPLMGAAGADPASFASNIVGKTRQLDPESMYRARCIWGQAHEKYHHSGPRPLHKHLSIKSRNFYCAALEELKVDMQVALDCASHRLPFSPAIFQYIMTERLFRYPARYTSNATAMETPQKKTTRISVLPMAANIDAATGLILRQQLTMNGGLIRDRGGRLALHPTRCVSAIQHLVDRSTSIESIVGDKAYCAAASDFVQETCRTASSA